MLNFTSDLSFDSELSINACLLVVFLGYDDGD